MYFLISKLCLIDDYTEYYDVVLQSLETKGSRACVAEIEKATRAVSDLTRSKESVGMTTLKNLFRFENQHYIVRTF